MWHRKKTIDELEGIIRQEIYLSDPLAVSALEQLANRAREWEEELMLLPCYNRLEGAECPDYWAVGINVKACPSCEARERIK